jgi:hypothetical protein
VASQDRTRIVAESRRALPSAGRLELTALGGSLSARGDWDDFQWEQDVALGRDQRVRFAISGVLYPLGHRAVFTELTERQMDGGPAVLRQRRTLAVTEPVRSSAGDDPVHRRFPFDEFELTTVWYEDLPDPDEPGTPSSWRFYVRPVPVLEDQRARTADLQAQAANLAAQVSDEGNRFRPPDELAGLGMPEAGQLLAAQDKLPQEQTQLDVDRDAIRLRPQLRAQEAEIIRRQHIPGISEEAAEALFEALQDVRNQLANLPNPSQADVDRLADRVQRLQDQISQLALIVDREGHRFRDLNELAQLSFQPAVDLLSLQPTVTAAEAKLAELEQIAAEQLKLFFTPPVRFPVRGRGRAGDVCFDLPLIFVVDFTLAPTEDLPGVRSLTDPGVIQRLHDAYALSAMVPLPAARVDLVRAAGPRPADVHEVHEMTISGTPHEGGFHPQADQFKVALPALRTLLDDPDLKIPLKFRPGFFDPAQEVPNPPREVALVLDAVYHADFAKVPGRAGALVTPSFAADAISRLHGPVALAGTIPDAVGKLSPDKVFGDAARILGFRLADLIPALDHPPQIQLQPPSTVTMTWRDVKLSDHQPIRTKPSTKLNLTVERSPGHISTRCDIADLTLQFPLLDVAIGSIAYTQVDDHPPRLELHGVTPDVSGPLRLLKQLLDRVNLGQAGPEVHVTGKEISASYALPVPDVHAVGFSLRGVLFRLGVVVPLDGQPVTVEMGFASRAHPFLVSVLLFGGGGYVDLLISGGTVTRFEASLDFGAATSIGLGVATAEVHVLGGIRYVMTGSTARLDGYLRIGGGVEILGLISVSVELVVTLTYQEQGNALTGRATLVVTVDLTFYSDSVTLDTGEYRISGDPPPSSPPLAAAPDQGLAAWQAYRRAFRKERS